MDPILRKMILEVLKRQKSFDEILKQIDDHLKKFRNELISQILTNMFDKFEFKDGDLLTAQKNLMEKYYQVEKEYIELKIMFSKMIKNEIAPEENNCIQSHFLHQEVQLKNKNIEIPEEGLEFSSYAFVSFDKEEPLVEFMPEKFISDMQLVMINSFSTPDGQRSKILHPCEDKTNKSEEVLNKIFPTSLKIKNMVPVLHRFCDSNKSCFWRMYVKVLKRSLPFPSFDTYSEHLRNEAKEEMQLILFPLGCEVMKIYVNSYVDNVWVYDITTHCSCICGNKAGFLPQKFLNSIIF